MDLYLIHWARVDQGQYVEAWKGLIEAQKQGKATSIGVSNFPAAQLEEIIEATGGDQREIDERTERLGPAWRPKTAMLEVLQRLLPELMAPQAVPSS